MNSAIEQMLKSYHVENIYDRKNAMKEIMQEIVLCEFSTVSTASPRIWIFRWKRRIWTLT